MKTNCTITPIFTKQSCLHSVCAKLTQKITSAINARAITISVQFSERKMQIVVQQLANFHTRGYSFQGTLFILYEGYS